MFCICHFMQFININLSPKGTLEPYPFMMKTFLLLLLSLMLSPVVQAQKKAMDHDVYDGWKSLGQTQVSDNGRWLMYILTPQEGDNALVLTDRTMGKTDTLHRVSRFSWNQASTHAVYFITPSYEMTRKAKIKKVKKEDMPKDTLGIYTLDSKTLVKIAQVKSFKMPEKGSNWMAYLKEKDKEKPKATKPDTSKSTKTPEKKPETPAKEKAKRDEGTTLVLRDLSSGSEREFLFVSDYAFDEKGNYLAIASVGNDSTVKAGLSLVDLTTGSVKLISKGGIAYKNLTFNKEGNWFAFLVDRNPYNDKQRFYDLAIWNGKGDSAKVVADQKHPAMPQNWMVSEHATLRFSEKSQRLLFGTAPVPATIDTSIIEMDMAKLDVWHWQDKDLQPMQLVNLDRDKKKSYLAVIRLKDNALIQLATLNIPNVQLPLDGDADFALGFNDQPYRMASSWLGYSQQDVYMINPENGQASLLHQAFADNMLVSPTGKYLYWFSGEQKNWFVQPLKTKSIRNLTKDLGVAFFDEAHDTPNEPSPYGQMGWGDKDQAFYVYDKYDIWALDPLGTKTKNWTGGSGRTQKIRYRYQRVNPDEKFVDITKPVLLNTFNYVSKFGGFARQGATDSAPTALWSGPYAPSFVAKQKNAEVYWVMRGNFSELSELYETDRNFTEWKQRSFTNPQKEQYLWGEAELVSWISADGTPLEGILYKPEGFDPTKKYPMMVYFYETHSEGLYRSMGPAPSASTVNIPFFVSRGYLVFTPDIVYTEGYPGKSAENSIIPGTLSLIARGFVDEKRIAIQGQSWGGYQVAHLVTRTHLFAAAGAGAPVSNMTSAYGGIRWQTGMSRMFQYEKTQSRIGKTLWERPLYYLENSPLFRVPDIQTPLLMMHNDADGAVPWYQGIELFVAMRRLQKPVWMLNYNGEAHNLVQRVNRKDLSIRLSQFFDHYLLGAPAPEWMKEGVPALKKGIEWGFETD